MLFSEPSFLCFFLPLVLLAYFGLGARRRNLVLLVSSLFFYAWGEGAYVLVLLASILLNWVCGLLAAPGRPAAVARRAVVVGVAGNLALLVAFKYSNFLADNLRALWPLSSPIPFTFPRVHLPIGISFFAFQGMSYLIDVRRGVCAPEKGLVNLAMYKAFFPQLIAGPIVRYADVKSQIVTRTVTIDDFAEGVRRFIIGFGKKMIIANQMARPTDAIFALSANQQTGVLAWLAMAGYALQIYFDFSGYSDMAIGLGRMFGFRFLENFDHPYFATSMTDFWRRWHISLSSWFRDYLYIPLGGNRGSQGRVYSNLVIVFLLCGLWHGASWNFAIWGLFHGAFLIFERLPWPARLRQVWRPVRHAYVIGVVLVSWVFFRAETSASALSVLRAMAGLARPAGPVPGLGMFVDAEVIAVALLAVLGSTPIVAWLGERSQRWKARSSRAEWSLEAAQLVGLAVIFVYSTMLMAAGSYSPFIYFRF